MSNKNLLNESQIRQFMKLAQLEPLAHGFVEGLSETHGRGMNDAPQYDGRRRVQEEDELEAELGATEDELGAEDDLADEEAEELDDMGAAEMDVSADEGRMISVDDFLGALETALEGVMGDEVEIDSSEMSDEAPEDQELEVDAVVAPLDDEETEVAAAEEEELMEGSDEELEEAVTKGSDAEEDESLGMEDGKEADKDMSEKGRRKVARADARKDESTEATDELVEQITKRVAARILKSVLSKK